MSFKPLLAERKGLRVREQFLMVQSVGQRNSSRHSLGRESGRCDRPRQRLASLQDAACLAQVVLVMAQSWGSWSFVRTVKASR